MAQWILIGALACWCFTLEARVQRNKEDNDEHNAKIARQREEINMLNIQVDALMKEKTK